MDYLAGVAKVVDRIARRRGAVEGDKFQEVLPVACHHHVVVQMLSRRIGSHQHSIVIEGQGRIGIGGGVDGQGVARVGDAVVVGREEGSQQACIGRVHGIVNVRTVRRPTHDIARGIPEDKGHLEHRRRSYWIPVKRGHVVLNLMHVVAHICHQDGGRWLAPLPLHKLPIRWGGAGRGDHAGMGVDGGDSHEGAIALRCVVENGDGIRLGRERRVNRQNLTLSGQTHQKKQGNQA